jgi:hypothetical protein
VYNDDGHCNHDGQLFKKSSLNHFRMFAEKKAAKMPHHIKPTELCRHADI